jgi:hypothetical protein
MVYRLIRNIIPKLVYMCDQVTLGKTNNTLEPGNNFAISSPSMLDLLLYMIYSFYNLLPQLVQFENLSFTTIQHEWCVERTKTFRFSVFNIQRLLYILHVGTIHYCKNFGIIYIFQGCDENKSAVFRPDEWFSPCWETCILSVMLLLFKIQRPGSLPSQSLNTTLSLTPFCRAVLTPFHCQLLEIRFVWIGTPWTLDDEISCIVPTSHTVLYRLALYQLS